MRRVYVYDRELGEVVERRSEPRTAAPQDIVKSYEHTARCLPLRAERDASGRVTKHIAGSRHNYDKGGRAVIGSRQEILDIKAANPHLNLNWDSE